jgi:hypothetical protein
VVPVLAEAKRLGTTAGRTIFAVLLFQDLMVAPLLFRRPKPQYHLFEPRHQVYLLDERPKFAKSAARRELKSSKRRM